MKKSFSLAFVLLTVVSMISLLIGCNDNQSNSPQKITFSCEQKDQDWITTVKNGQENKDLIIWQRTDFVPAGFPLKEDVKTLLRDYKKLMIMVVYLV